jgi:hypothetical protein
MKHLISISECVGQRETSRGPCDVYATADANYDEATQRITIKLESILRPVPARHGVESFREPWLPEPQTVQETVPLEEGDALTRDVFHSWVNRVKHAIPAAVS